MNTFSESSSAELKTCHRALRLTLKKAVNYYDFTVLEGHRGEERQNQLHEKGRSQLKWPKSKHNQSPSHAVDLAPYPIDWQDQQRFCVLAGVVFSCHKILKREGLVEMKLRWGGDWDMDQHLDDNKFDDLGHFELV